MKTEVERTMKTEVERTMKTEVERTMKTEVERTIKALDSYCLKIINICLKMNSYQDS
jgi:hypothetical protein